MRTLSEGIRRHRCDVVAVGNGTACRETENLVQDIKRASAPHIKYVIVNEAGASVYSVSDAAKHEFPDLEPFAIGAVSIGRRLQDPLAELVKVDPKHIGLGMYQFRSKSGSRTRLTESVSTASHLLASISTRARPTSSPRFPA